MDCPQSVALKEKLTASDIVGREQTCEPYFIRAYITSQQNSQYEQRKKEQVCNVEEKKN